MNINKIISKVSFDDFMSFLDKCSQTIINDEQITIHLLKSKSEPRTTDNIKNKLFIYFINKLCTDLY